MAGKAAAIRIGLFAVALALLFGGAYALGAALDPEVEEAESGGHGDAEAHASGEPSPDARPARLAVAAGGFQPGVRKTLAFRVVDRAGRAVEDFDVEHERRMHVIVARRDLTGYQHLHPRRTGDGWRVPVRFGEPGTHRVFADFASGGESYTLGADVEVSGAYRPRPLPPAARIADAGDGYSVTLSRQGGERSFTITQDGRPVDDVEPYLGARGHLVVLREGDLKFLHVHPQDAATEGRSVSFGVRFPSDGRYRMFLQFRHDGRVRTAAFTERVGGSEATHEDGGEHGH